MKSEETQRWIQAGSLLAEDPDRKVLCPKCQEAFLTVRDVKYEKKPERFDRYLVCPKCRARTVIVRMGKPEENGD